VAVERVCLYLNVVLLKTDDGMTHRVHVDLEGISLEAHKMNQTLLYVLIKDNAYVPSIMGKRRSWLWPRELHCNPLTAVCFLRYVVISVSVVYIYLMSVVMYAGKESVRKCTTFEALRKDSIR